jgi:phosphopantothenoylcysteine decarboxylase/phosphopantothenate--cysteine ligase
MLTGKTVVLGVTGSIAAYKIANLASMLVKKHADVHVIMTENATNFINPITFETLTGNKCIVDTFDRNFQYDVKHISLAKKADVFMVAPASANVIGKIASGIADDMLTTTIMAATCRKIIAPAMNTGMLENPIVQDNLKKLSDYGYEIIDSATGYLACGDTGKGKLPEPEVLEAFILREIAKDKDLSGVKLMVTAGPTCEPIDPVRYITNHSTGKMGYAIARQAMLRGAQVTLITGKVNIEPPAFVEVVDVTTAQDMYDAVMEKSDDMDVIVKAAAVADYRPATVADNKIKKNDGDMSIPLTRTKDILQALGSRRQEEKLDGQIICGFSMETKDLLENSKKKIQKKNIDLIAANNLKVEGAGFGVDTNVLTLITRDSVKELPLMTKDECADALLDAIISMRNKK